MDQVERFQGFADYYGQTLLHPLALAVTVILMVAVLWTPRRYALVPLLLALTTLPVAQRLVVAGADFTLFRMLLLAYLVRVLFRQEWRGITWNRLDSAIILWVVSGFTIMTIHYGTFDVVVNRAGWAYNIILTYFAGRFLIRQWDELLVLAKAAVVISVPMAAAFVYEWLTQYNMFHVFGGVRENTWMRDGVLRCQGPFAHPIIAGTYWSALLPLMWMLWKGEGQSRVLVVIGTAAGLLIIASTGSSTPLLALMAAVFGAAIFIVRDHRTKIWVGFFAGLFILHFFVMKTPVWHLISRVDVVAGSTGWHRYAIIDAFVRNFSDWWLTGYTTPTDWAWQMRDVTNQFIGIALSGGFLTLVLFLLVLTWAFGNVGRSLARAAASASVERSFLDWRIWMVGVILFIHVVTFFGLAYFGQLQGLLYLQLSFAAAVAGGLSSETHEPGVSEQGQAKARGFGPALPSGGSRLAERSHATFVRGGTSSR